MSYDMPENKMCHEINPDLWEMFHNVWKSVHNVRPTGDWTEEEVVQWLDTYRDQEPLDEPYNDEQAWTDYQESVADYYSSLEYNYYDDAA